MIEVELKEWGNSVGVLIPKSILRDLGLHKGDTVSVEIISKKKIDGFGRFRGAPSFKRDHASHREG